MRSPTERPRRSPRIDPKGPLARYRPSGFFALRTPLLPFDELLRFAEGLEAPSAVSNPEDALQRDHDRLHARLLELLARSDVLEALFLASPDLVDALEAWKAAPRGEKGRRTAAALVRYLARMAGRPTPFGLFASNAVGRIGETTDLSLEGELLRHTRLDMDALAAVDDAVRRDRGLRGGLALTPNPTLYGLARRYRYIEQRIQGTERSYHLVAVEAAPPVAAALAAARGTPAAEIAQALVDEDVTAEEAAAFVDELVDAQVLVADLGLAVTGEEPARGFAEHLSRHAATAAAGRLVGEAVRALAGLDAHGVGIPPERYREIASGLAALPAAPRLSRLFQVDLSRSAPRAVLGTAVVDELLAAAEMLVALAPPRRGDLEAFREAFVERYEGQAVPFHLALDEENGIGFPPHPPAGAEGAPLLAGLPFPENTGRSLRWGAREDFLLRKLAAALASGARNIELERREVEELAATPRTELPDAFAIIARLGASSSEALARGDFVVAFEALGGPSGANLLGRFCHADSALAELVTRHLREEEALEPEAVFAEIVHLPEGRLGNVLLRPVLRDHEIPFLGVSGAACDRQLPLSDLLVSVEDGRVVLRSRRLGKRVLPRLTTAHNFSTRGLGPYRFLCELQSQGRLPGLFWSWGPLGSAPFLPRVTCGRAVLSPARWSLTRAEREKLGESRDGEAGRGGGGAPAFAEVQTLRRRMGWPRFVLLVEDDNLLPVDLDNALSVESFAALVRKRERFDVQEMVPGPEELCAEGPGGKYVHELVVPFVKTSQSAAVEAGGSAARAPRSARFREHVLERRFSPGSEWLTAKLYSGPATGDRILVESVAPLVEELRGADAIDRWFFVRYGDPRDHLRLRFHGEPGRLHDEVLPRVERVAAALLSHGEAWRYQLDTYEREVERYGGPRGVELAERFFAVDSDAVLALLAMLEDGDAGSEERWRLALRSADMLLSDLGFGLPEKRAISARLAEAFAREHAADPALGRAIGQRYREVSASLARLLDPSYDAESSLAPGLEVLEERSRSFRPIALELRRLEAEGDLSVEALAESFVHLHWNRLLRSAHRRQELVLHDFLARLYATRAARS